MAKITTSIAVAEERIINKIYNIRKQKVMLDRDLEVQCSAGLDKERILNQFH